MTPKILIPTKPQSALDKGTDLVTQFNHWASGRTVPTSDELVDVFANLNNLTPDQAKMLKRIKAAETPAAAASAPQRKPAIPPQKPLTPAKDIVIPGHRYPRWWDDLMQAPINITGPAQVTIVSGRPGFRLFIASIVFGVDGETDISFVFGASGASGAIPFGGTDEPRAAVIAMGNSPAACGAGLFQMGSTGAGIKVGGFTSFFLVPK